MKYLLKSLASSAVLNELFWLVNEIFISPHVCKKEIVADSVYLKGQSCPSTFLLILPRVVLVLFLNTLALALEGLVVIPKRASMFRENSQLPWLLLLRVVGTKAQCHLHLALAHTAHPTCSKYAIIR